MFDIIKIFDYPATLTVVIATIGGLCGIVFNFPKSYLFDAIPPIPNIIIMGLQFIIGSVFALLITGIVIGILYFGHLVASEWVNNEGKNHK